MKHTIFFALLLATISINAQQKIYSSDKYQVYTDKVVQGKYTAKVAYPTQITSDYKSPANLFMSADIVFKFAINGRDNEMSSGIDHVFSTADFGNTTPIIKFGQQLKKPSASQKFLAPNTPLQIRLDMSDVLKQFKEKGYYTTFAGDKIYKEEFKGVFIAGSSAPLSWDFDNLAKKDEFKLQDSDNDGIYTISLIFNKPSDANVTDEEWKLSKDISPYPQFQSGILISDAIYNMGLDEMLKAIEPDSTFRTGKEWGGVWTRDISYSIILSMAYMQPRVAMHSLMKKVNAKKKIIQDTGTGGAWPISTDRAVWIIAAYEVYKATGDKKWLEQVFEIAENSMQDDIKTNWDGATGLFNGESSFLDWREQTYPKWMEPKDIYQSKNLGTNAVFYQANISLAEMANLLGKTNESLKYNMIAGTVKNGINRYLWLEDKGYYAQYLYGRNYQLVSPKSEALGEALCIIFGIADEKKARRITASVPLTDFGISCIYPQIPGILPYHNNAVWPFVQSYWLQANAKAGNAKGVLESIAAIYRPAALFATNKENFVADDGDFKGTQINSSIMLWSLSGNISIVHKVLFGLKFDAMSLSFQPFVPKALEGRKTLKNFKYRNAVLDIDMEGYGNKIESMEMDGKPYYLNYIDETLKGRHTIHIKLNNAEPETAINKPGNYTTLVAPKAFIDKGKLKWQSIDNAIQYRIYRNGEKFKDINANELLLADRNYAEYAVSAIDDKGVESFISEPVRSLSVTEAIYQAETFAAKSTLPYKDFTGDGFVGLTLTENTKLSFEVQTAKAGYYFIDARYSNGSGPLNTENKCGIRSLFINEKETAVMVFPQRGKDEWSIWGFTNAIKVYLPAGKNTIALQLRPHNDNMNLEVNSAMIDYIRLTPLVN